MLLPCARILSAAVSSLNAKEELPGNERHEPPAHSFGDTNCDGDTFPGVSIRGTQSRKDQQACVVCTQDHQGLLNC